MNNKKRILNFLIEHKDYRDEIINDTWLCTEPIDERETRACWYFCNVRGQEPISADEFESHYDITFREIANYFNETILKL